MLLSILLLGFLVRLINLNQSLWLDEGTTAQIARDFSWTEFFTNFLPNDFHPPLYYLIVKAATGLIGNYSELALRITSLVAGVSSIYVVYKIAEIKSKKLAILSSLFLCTSPLHIYYSQEARGYMLLCLFVALSFFFYINKRYFLFSLSLAASMWTEYLAILIIPVFILHSFSTKKANLAKTFYFMVLSAVMCAPILLFFPNQLSRGLIQEGSAWWGILGQTNLKNIVLILVKFMIGRISFARPLYELIVIFLSVFFGVFYTFSLYNFKKLKLVWYWLLIPLLGGVLLGMFVPVLSYFRFIFVLPAYYILLASGILKSPPKFGIIASVLIVFLNLWFSFTYLLNSQFHREDWRRFALETKASSVNKSAVLFPAKSQREAYNYYTNSDNVVEVNELDEQTEIWLVRYVYDIVDPADNTRIKLEERGFIKTEEYNFNGVVVWKFSKYEDSN